MAVQSHLVQTPAWGRNLGEDLQHPCSPAARSFNCHEKGSQRLLPSLSEITVPGSLGMARAVDTSPSAEDGREEGPGLTGCPCVCPLMPVAMCRMSPRNPRSSSPKQESRKGKQGWEKWGCLRRLPAALLWEPLGAPTGISHLTYRLHQNKLSLWARFGLEEAARSMNPACSWGGYGGPCHIIIFINPLSFILKLARAQFLLFLLESSSRVSFLCWLEIM